MSEMTQAEFMRIYRLPDQIERARAKLERLEALAEELRVPTSRRECER